MNLVNTCIQEHRNISLECDTLEIDIANYIPWGTSCRFARKCTHCDYISERMPMYDQIESARRGPKAARTNMGLQLGLQDTPIGNERARLLMGYMGMRTGSRSGMQKTSDRAGHITNDTTDEDLHDKVAEIKAVNAARGLGEDAPISAAFDVRYGGMRMSNSYRPGQGAGDGIGLLVENVTNSKAIIGVYVENKLCYHGAWLRKQGVDVSCPGHEGCSATISSSDLISEKKIAKELGRKITKDHGLFISHITTDSDAKGPSGIEEAMKEVRPTWKLHKMKDPTHLSQGQKRFVLRAKFSAAMFAHIGRAPLRNKAQEALASDLAQRCAFVHKRLHLRYRGNMDLIHKRAHRAVDCILDCYRGEHSSCKGSVFSFTCKGRKGKTWLDVSDHLKGLGISNFNPTDDDMKILRQAVNLRLGREVLHSTRLRKTTQGCESRNAGLSTSLPRNRRFMKNVKARANSAVLRMNNGPKTSMEKKMREGNCEMPGDSLALDVFRQQEHRQNYSVAYKKRPQTKKWANILRKRRLEKHYHSMRKRHCEWEYEKFQLDRALWNKQKVKQRTGKPVRRRIRKLTGKKPVSHVCTVANAKVRQARETLRDALERQGEIDKSARAQRAQRRACQKRDHLYVKH